MTDRIRFGSTITAEQVRDLGRVMAQVTLPIGPNHLGDLADQMEKDAARLAKAEESLGAYQREARRIAGSAAEQFRELVALRARLAKMEGERAEATDFSIVPTGICSLLVAIDGYGPMQFQWNDAELTRNIIHVIIDTGITTVSDVPYTAEEQVAFQKMVAPVGSTLNARSMNSAVLDGNVNYMKEE